MELDVEQLRAAFGEQSGIFVDLVDRTRDLSMPTTLEGWDCAVLVGHVSTAVEALWRWQADVPPGAPEVDAVAWWDGVDAGTNDTFSQRYAAKRSHEQLRELIASAVRRANDLLPTMTADATLVAPGGIAWTRFDQALATRILELTVHGLDLAAATGSTIAMSPTALTITGRILDERLDGPRPADLSDDAGWVAAATGRAPHGDSRLPVVA